MNKIPYEEINNQQLVDVRTQHEYQAGHLKNALNLNPSNFKKYATYYLDVNQPVIFIVGSEEESHLEELSESADALGFTQNNGYLLIEEVPKENLKTTETIPAEDFLNISGIAFRAVGDEDLICENGNIALCVVIADGIL